MSHRHTWGNGKEAEEADTGGRLSSRKSEGPEVVGDSGKRRGKVEELMRGQICLLCTTPALTLSEMEGCYQVLSKAI